MKQTKTKTKTVTTNDTNGFTRLLIHLINVSSAILTLYIYNCAMCSFPTFVILQPFTMSQIILNTLPCISSFYFGFAFQLKTDPSLLTSSTSEDRSVLRNAIQLKQRNAVTVTVVVCYFFVFFRSNIYR